MGHPDVRTFGWQGMKSVDTIARIRREYFVRGKSIKQIVRELHVSRNTVRKVLRSDATEFVYERDVQPLPKLGRFTDELDQLLTLNEAKAPRERLTLIRLFEDLRDRGYAGSYDAVRRYARSWQRQRTSLSSSAYVPLTFAPGEAYQFDWSHEVVVLAGVTTIVKVAHIRLCHSRMMFVRAYPRETQEMVFDAHDRAFAFFKGACQRGIYDNLKAAVETVFVGKERAYNRRFFADVQPFSDRAGGLHPCLRLGEGAGRESGRTGPQAILHATAAVQDLRRAQLLARGQVHRLRQGAQASGIPGPDNLASFRSRATQPGALSWPVRWLPCRTGVDLQDMPDPLR